jgi:hypothetical protein
MIYFSRRTSVSFWPALLAISLTIATPSWLLLKWAGQTTFRPDAPHVFRSADHDDILTSLRAVTKPDDVLLADLPDVLWLAPEYSGKHYCGHFFLTVNFDQRRSSMVRFFESGPEEQAVFLKREGIRFLYVSPRQQPSRFSQIPGWTTVIANSAGAVFQSTL